MADARRPGSGRLILAELEEFASFAKGAQRYIRRSLDVGLGRLDAVQRWARNEEEAQAIRLQQSVYAGLDEIGALIPEDDHPASVTPLLATLIGVSAFDLSQGWLTSFAAYRFLYERLVGAAVRPFLPSVFCAVATLPYLHPEDRRELLPTIGDAAAAVGWSTREPSFIPEWVEKVDAPLSV